MNKRKIHKYFQKPTKTTTEQTEELRLKKHNETAKTSGNRNPNAGRGAHISVPVCRLILKGTGGFYSVVVSSAPPIGLSIGWILPNLLGFSWQMPACPAEENAVFRERSAIFLGDIVASNKGISV